MQHAPLPESTTPPVPVELAEFELSRMDNPSLLDVLDVLTKLRASNNYSNAPGPRMIGVIQNAQPDTFILHQIERIANSASKEAFRDKQIKASDAYRLIELTAYLKRIQTPIGVATAKNKSVHDALAA